MPTVRPRHSVTETDRVARALDAAARRWPEDRASRGRLLVHLIDLGWSSLQIELTDDDDAWQHTVDQTAGVLAGVYGAGYLDRMREEWPE